MKHIFFAITLFVSTTSFAQTKISSEKALEDLNKNKSIQLLDVRTTKEFGTKHLKDAINIDWKDQATFEPTVANLDKSKPLYIYCLGGGRSAEAAKKLSSMGFEVYDIEGGIMKWEANNLPVVQHEHDESTPSKGMSLQEYTQLSQDNEILLIDFYAPWCAPCQELMPRIDKISKKYTNKVKVVKIDVDQNPQLVKSLGINSIPTLYIYKNGKKTWSTTKLESQKTIEKQLK